MEAPGGLGRLRHPSTTRAAALHPVEHRRSGRTRRFWFEGEVFLNQGSTGTCVGNALGHRYADGPVRHPGIDEAWAQRLYVDASGDQTLEVGTSALEACRVLLARGEVSAFHWILTPGDLRATLLEVGSVCVGVDWFASMDRPVQQFDNSYLPVDFASPIRGGHEFVLNAIDLAPAFGGPAYYRMKNSWGKGWAHGGTARVACDDMEALLFGYGGDAVLIDEVA